ncbi:MAG: retroviral-like aspartic protease family protein [Nitrospinota bacterium]|nr:retroviral-like aspartic protease family protein [Nitrospinota bacterium]
MQALIIAAILMAGAADDAKVYRWTDAAGNVRAAGSLAAVPEPFRDAAVEMKVTQAEHTSIQHDPPAESVGQARISFPPGAGRIVAQAAFDGKASRMALVDTGSDLVAITTKLARALGYDLSKSRKTWIATSSGRTQVPIIRLNRLEVGGAMAKGVTAVVMDFEGRGAVSAVLGMSFLSAFVFEIDSGAGSMTLTAP